MRIRHWKTMVGVLLVLTILLSACQPIGAPAAEEVSGSAETIEALKVAFVYVGPVGDLGWSYAHDQGRLALEELGVETAFSELVAEGPDAARVLQSYASQGYDLIFATSFGYMDSVIEVAAEFPEVKFEHATGYKTSENVGIYDGRGYQGWYLAGMVAGAMTQSNVPRLHCALPDSGGGAKSERIRPGRPIDKSPCRGAAGMDLRLV